MPSIVDQSAAQQRVARMAKQVEVANKDIATTPELKGAQMLGVQYCDVGREKYTVVGNNLNDFRVMSSWFEKDENGHEIPGTATPLALCHVMSETSNYEDGRATISTQHFNTVVADPDGTNKRYETLDNVLGSKFRTIFREEGLEQGCNMSTEQVAVAAPRFAFIERPPDETKMGVKFVVTSWSYNTTNDANPKNMMLFCDPMNTSMHLETPGRDGVQHLHTKVMNGEGQWKAYSSKITATSRTIENIGTETKEESRAAAARGEGTQVNLGPITWKGQSCASFVIQCELKGNAPVQASLSSASIPVGVPLTNEQYAQMHSSNDQPVYRSLADLVDDDDDDDDGAQFRSLSSEPRRSVAVEGRTGIGSCEGDARKLTKTKLESAKKTCLATPVFFVMMDYGTSPSVDSMKQAYAHSKTCHDLTISIGKNLHSRHSEEAEAEGLTAPMTKIAKTEFTHNTGVKMETNANPTPVLTGVPV